MESNDKSRESFYEEVNRIAEEIGKELEQEGTQGGVSIVQEQAYQHPQSSRRSRMLDIIADRIAKRTGRDKETIKIVLEELINEDEKLLETLEKFGRVKRMLISGDVSNKYSDIEAARLIRRAGSMLERKILSGEDISISDLIKLQMLKMIMDDYERNKDQKPIVYRYPMIDPNTGEVVRDANGNVVYIEVPAPPGAMPFPPFIAPPRREKNEEVEALREELQKLREEFRSVLQEKEVGELRRSLEDLSKKLADLESRIIELKNTGGEGGSPSMGIRDIANQVTQMIQAIEQLGFKVKKPGEEEEKRQSGETETLVELKKMDREIMKTIIENIVPALAELIRNPEKIARVVNFLRTLSQAQAAQVAVPAQQIRVQAPPVPRPPSLEEFLRGVTGGESGSEKGEGGS